MIDYLSMVNFINERKTLCNLIKYANKIKESIFKGDYCDAEKILLELDKNKQRIYIILKRLERYVIIHKVSKKLKGSDNDGILFTAVNVKRLSKL